MFIKAMEIAKEIQGKLRRDGIARTSLSIIFHLIRNKDRLYVSELISDLLNNEVPLHGVVLDLNSNIISEEIKARIITGGYESEERYLAEKYLPSTTPVVELGGSIGYISCYLANFIIPDERLVVVEADEELVPILRHHRDINQCHFDIINSAYHPKKESVRFSAGEFVTGGQITNDGAHQIKAISLEDVLSDFKTEEFNLVCDIEGAELELMKKEIDILKQRCKIIILEHHNNHTEINRILGSNGFHEKKNISNVSVYENNHI